MCVFLRRAELASGGMRRHALAGRARTWSCPDCGEHSHFGMISPANVRDVSVEQPFFAEVLNRMLVKERKVDHGTTTHTSSVLRAKTFYTCQRLRCNCGRLVSRWVTRLLLGGYVTRRDRVSAPLLKMTSRLGSLETWPEHHIPRSLTREPDWRAASF